MADKVNLFDMFHKRTPAPVPHTTVPADATARSAVHNAGITVTEPVRDTGVVAKASASKIFTAAEIEAMKSGPAPIVFGADAIARAKGGVVFTNSDIATVKNPATNNMTVTPIEEVVEAAAESTEPDEDTIDDITLAKLKSFATEEEALDWAENIVEKTSIDYNDLSNPTLLIIKQYCVDYSGLLVAPVAVRAKIVAKAWNANDCYFDFFCSLKDYTELYTG